MLAVPVLRGTVLNDPHSHFIETSLAGVLNKVKHYAFHYPELMMLNVFFVPSTVTVSNNFLLYVGCRG